MNRTILGIAALTLTLLVAGCGGKSDQTTSTGGSASAPAASGTPPAGSAGSTAGSASTNAARTTAGSGAMSGSAVTSGSGAMSSSSATSSNLDDGPRAAEEPVNEAMAAHGEKLFQTRVCATCHGFGKKITCPDLDAVTQRRTARWIQSQILHPEIMTKQDSTARQLFAQYKLQMPNQNLAPADAQALLEFLKHKNRESSGKR